MALVRCTCVAAVAPAERGLDVAVAVADPECGYAPHRLVDATSAADH